MLNIVNATRGNAGVYKIDISYPDSSFALIKEYRLSKFLSTPQAWHIIIAVDTRDKNIELHTIVNQ